MQLRHAASAELFEYLVMMDSLANHRILPDLHRQYNGQVSPAAGFGAKMPA